MCRHKQYLIVLTFLCLFLIQYCLLDKRLTVPHDTYPKANEGTVLDHKAKEDIAQEPTAKVPVHPCSCSRLLDISLASGNLSISNNSARIKSSCSEFATARGGGQKVVSYSLYGTFPNEYFEGLVKLIHRVKEVYSGWLVRVYMDLSNKDIREWACAIACEHQHVDFCDTNTIPELGNVSDSIGKLWRFFVVGDPLVEKYIIRDTDMPIIQREVDAVNEWLKSGKCFHVMRDNLFHDVVMMGGMWGGCNTQQQQLPLLQQIRKKFLIHGMDKQQDQPLLAQHMWPEVKKNMLQHDSYSCQRFSGSLPFPTKREGYEFIGMRTYRKEFENDRVYPPCPEECRPKEHKDWEFC